MILYCASNGIFSLLRDVAWLFLGGSPDSQTDRNYGGGGNKNELREQRGPKIQTRRVSEKRRNSEGGGLRSTTEEFCPKEKMEGVFYIIFLFVRLSLPKSTSPPAQKEERFLKEGHSRRNVFLCSKTRQGKKRSRGSSRESDIWLFSPNAMSD